MRLTAASNLRLPKPLKSFKAFPVSRPTSSLAQLAHFTTLALLPFVVLLLVRADITLLAILLVLLAKWRMLAVRPRFWLANIRANSIDIIVGLSTVVFLINAPGLAWQLVWTVLYVLWLVLIKPSSKIWLVGLQALIGETYGLIALYIAWGGVPLFAMTLVAGLICYLAARHFFDVFDEVYAKLLSYLWGLFGAAVTWLLGHLLFFYGPLSQPTLLIVATSFGAATLYYLDHFDRSSKLARRQVALLLLAVVVILFIKLVPLMFYVWSDNVL